MLAANILKADDKRLTQYVETVNSFIIRLNTDMKTFSPSLNEDLRRSRKAKNKKQRYSVRYNMYTDGIHPKQTIKVVVEINQPEDKKRLLCLVYIRLNELIFV